LLENKVAFEEREINAKPLNEAELDALIGKRDYLGFLNSRNELYRERKMKEKPPTREQALKLMAAEPNLMKRPILAVGKDIVLGFDEEEFRKVT
jgi:arsenate reductase-like glutaredoxin family protein